MCPRQLKGSMKHGNSPGLPEVLEVKGRAGGGG